MAGESQKKLEGLPLYLIMLGMLIAGTGNTILVKVQNYTHGEQLPNPPYPVYFKHPYVQCAVMFIGELLCLFAYGAKLLFLRYQRSKNGEIVVQEEEVIGKQLRTDINPLLLAIPAAFDVIASSLMNIALTEVAASVYQMLRGMKIVVTAGMSILFLKKKLYKHHWSSVGCIFFGLILVGIAVLTGDSSSSIGSSPLGIIILLVATVFSSCLYIVEEKILGDYYLDPLKVVGLEGLWGLIIWTILLPIFQQINCTSEKLCPYGKLEDTMQAFRDYGANSTLIWLSVAVCFTMAFFNGFGVAVTKNASSAQRATIDTARTLLIWVFFLIVALDGKREKFYWLQLFGFVFLVIGTLVFNEIIIVPYLGFDQNTKKAIAARNAATEEHPPQGFSGTTPLIASQVQRNQRQQEAIQKQSQINHITTDSISHGGSTIEVNQPHK